MSKLGYFLCQKSSNWGSLFAKIPLIQGRHLCQKSIEFRVVVEMRENHTPDQSVVKYPWDLKAHIIHFWDPKCTDIKLFLLQIL